MMQHDEPDDFVIATGESHAICEFLELAFVQVDLDWQDHVEIDPHNYRYSEVDLLLGDATKAQKWLGWIPQISLSELARIMIDSDMEKARQEAAIAKSVM